MIGHELLLGLFAEVLGVDQEQDALGVGVFQQAVDEVMAVKVLPEPVAIWMRARGLSALKEASRLVMATIWQSRRPVGVSVGRSLGRAAGVRREVPASSHARRFRGDER